MVIALKDLEGINEIKNILVSAGYIWRGPIELQNDRYQFLKENDIKRDFHIYFTTLGSVVWNRFVLYRDYLLEHPNDLKNMKNLKKD